MGIGASAGGLAALKTLFEHMPDRSGLAFVVVVHLSPEHESYLADLLQPHVRMPVAQVTETVPLEPNHVYVIAPGCNLSAVDTHLRLSELEEQRSARAPIDHFFRTLSQTHDGHSVGVILTGTGSDGTLGLKHIKEQGGLTVVQSPGEAEYDGMPQSAIATGLVDLVLPLAQIPGAILRFAGTEPQVTVPGDGEDLQGNERQLLQTIFALLVARTGRDFGRYKRSTIMRRIEHRMQLRQVKEFEAYQDLLHEDTGEVQALADDFLIVVTTFFRDPEIFEKLEQEVIPKLFQGRSPDEAIRVWSVGCATGEEAYSLAILLIEESARREARGEGPLPRLQVFASDLHERSLQKAREGFYPGNIEANMSPERLERFFEKENGGYRVRKEVRERVVFAPHNLLGDPPFSKLDLVSCRNVLIYLERDVQKEIAQLFHYALRADGFLVLGTSETVAGSGLFRVVSKAHCLFRKRNVPVAETRLPVFPLTRARPSVLPMPARRPAAPATLGALHQQMVERYAPPSLIVSPDDTVIHSSEQVWRYLRHPGGTSTDQVLKLLREELQLELRSALHTAREKRQPTRTHAVSLAIEGILRQVTLDVRPALEADQEGFALVLFDEREAPEASEAESKAVAPPPDHTDDASMREVQIELDLARHRLKVLADEHETSQEEMRAAMEELQSTNEELRSTMEELETSKEELQSMNEELQTLNQESRHKVDELAQLSGDLQNLLTATDIATLFLDRELRILRFTPKASELFNVRLADRGRPLTDLTNRLGYVELWDDAARVLRHLVPVEREVQDEAGRWYLTRVLPYRSVQDRIEGVVVTLIDITSRKATEAEVVEAKRYAESIFETIHEPLLVLTPELHVRSANPAFYEHFQVSPEETIGCLIYELGNGQWNIPALRQLLEDVLPENNVFNDFEITHTFEQIGRLVMLVNGRRLDHVQFILLGIHDITERKEAEEALHELNETLEERVEERTQEVRALATHLTRAEQEERRRIAQILHDDLQQILFGIRVRLRNIAMMLTKQGEPEDVLKEIKVVDAWAEGALDKTRRLSVDLSPPILKSEGLADVLMWLRPQMADLYGLEVEIEAEHAFRMKDEGLRLLLFQIVRELVFNVKKHAGVDRATIRLREEEGQVVIEVADEGRGYDVGAAERKKGFGLYSVQERLRLLGGRIEIESHPGAGTRMTVYAPVGAEASNLGK